MPALLSMIAALALMSSPAAQAAPGESQAPKADQGAAAPEHVKDLIRDLGGDQAERDRARAELLRMGESAVPYLEKAAKDPDAERAMSARSLILEIMDRTGKPAKPAPDVRVVYHDWGKGIYFVRRENGHVLLRVPEANAQSGKREFKDYSATSLEEFKTKYPEVAKKYDVDKLASPEALSERVHRDWEEAKKRLGLGHESEEGTPRASGDLESWWSRHEEMMRRRLKEWDEGESKRPQAPSGPSFGVLVAPAGPALLAQLGAGVHTGLVVHEVKPGSIAEKAGVQKYDVITTLDGKPVQDFSSFRDRIERELASSNHFSIDVYRAGKPQKIEVNPKEAK